MKNRRIKSLTIRLAAVAALLGAALPLQATYAQMGAGAQVDWNSQIVQATDFGTVDMQRMRNKPQAMIMALQAARVNAMAKLAEALNDVNIDQRHLVKDGLAQGSVVSAKLSASLHGAFEIDRNVEWIEGTPMARVTMGVCMTRSSARCQQQPNALIDAVPQTAPAMSMPSLPGASAPVAPMQPAPAPAQAMAAVAPAPQLPAASQPAPAPAPIAQPLTDHATGLVVSLGGAAYNPSLHPVIYTGTPSQPDVVYSGLMVDMEAYRKLGVAAFAPDLAQAKAQSVRVGEAPMVVAAQGADEYGIRISAEDANRIRFSTTHGDNFLRAARVIIASGN
ncbi:hypothetical protein [Magnetofaba australis]|uniref:Uncharacterized protein n=1 Tax=Magnetofaba australis IT-1 TaxID=1434232 RepID=A0A1Y2K8X0_9PROT|nr:hypothetical protein [Magnetofaba australis]OSM07163.1 hypothetical protein MAIT1_03918 [Magnetofaba australis IT-1]